MEVTEWQGEASAPGPQGETPDPVRRLERGESVGQSLYCKARGCSEGLASLDNVGGLWAAGWSLVVWYRPWVIRAEEYCLLEGKSHQRRCSERGLWIGWFSCESHAPWWALCCLWELAATPGGAVSPQSGWSPRCQNVPKYEKTSLSKLIVAFWLQPL